MVFVNLEVIVDIAIDAGRAIMEVYERAEDFEITHKDDDSPLTEADLAAHNVIVAGLQTIDSTPIVSEEGRVGDPRYSDKCWLVDPLDGTKEFIKRNGMFTVNIALMRRHGERWNPLFGVVHAPVSGTTWFGGEIHASERRGQRGQDRYWSNRHRWVARCGLWQAAPTEVRRTSLSLRHSVITNLFEWAPPSRPASSQRAQQISIRDSARHRVGISPLLMQLFPALVESLLDQMGKHWIMI